jgi:hypothetical protein
MYALEEKRRVKNLAPSLNSMKMEKKPLQRAATVAPGAGGVGVLPAAVRARGMGVMGGNAQLNTYGTINIAGFPSYGRNKGSIVGNGVNHSDVNILAGTHTEAILIDRAYGGPAGAPTWVTANAAIDADNLLAGGANARNHFALISERVPCPGICAPALGNARYDPADTVNWAFPNTQGVTDSYMGLAHAWANAHHLKVTPGNWGVGRSPGNPALIRATRAKPVVEAPKPEGKDNKRKREPDGDPEVGKLKSESVVKKGKLTSSGKSGGIESGSKGNPILVS